MWGDFTIGDKSCGNSAYSLGIEDCDISENSSHYWWRDSDYNFGGTIEKNSKCGQKIKELISQNPKKVQGFIRKEAIKLIKPERILSLIKESYRNGYESGKLDKQKEICKALGVYRY